ncbi:MAG TPA: Uma2 family endonuclease [Isosphaeraceae bacterium]|nr:Uma2 family endonuclease [Isosphaeraceae bacterium]
MATDTQMQTQAPVTITGDPVYENRHPITVEEYFQIINSGALGPEPKVELIEGVIVDKMTKNNPHIIATDLVQILFGRLMPAGYYSSMGNPVIIKARNSVPEPDAVVARGNPRDIRSQGRLPESTALAVEVADTSYALDRNRKSQLYASAGIPIFWLLDLNRRRLEVFSNPTGQDDQARYEKTDLFEEKQEAPFVLDGQEIGRFAISEILP